MGAETSFRLDRGETFGEERILSSYLRVILGRDVRKSLRFRSAASILLECKGRLG